MRLERLELVDFRNYATAVLQLAPGAQVIVGANAQGKTNLVEALHYLAVGGSHRVASDAPLVRRSGPDEQPAQAAVVRAVARVATGRTLTVELELRPGGRNRARVDGQPQPRPRDAIGRLRSVLFAPEDLALVRGDPAERRRFLDDLLTQRRPAYVAARQEYERVLRQRNALLRALRAGDAGAGETLGTWSEALAVTGATIVAARTAAVHALAGPLAAAYADLVTGAPSREAAGEVGLAYELSTGRRVPAQPGAGVPDPALAAEELAKGLAVVAAAERERGLTLVGPHRDDLVLSLNRMPARGYASHGETWSLALALRLASREVLAEVGEEPVVLLDDVFSELDERRRQRLADRCATFEQVVVTAAVDADVPLPGPRLRVEAGSVTPAPAPVSPGTA